MISSEADSREALLSAANVYPSDLANNDVAAGSAALNRGIHRIFPADSAAVRASLAAVLAFLCFPAVTALYLSSAGPDYGPYTVEESVPQEQQPRRHILDLYRRHNLCHLCILDHPCSLLCLAQVPFETDHPVEDPLASLLAAASEACPCSCLRLLLRRDHGSEEAKASVF